MLRKAVELQVIVPSADVGRVAVSQSPRYVRWFASCRVRRAPFFVSTKVADVDLGRGARCRSRCAKGPITASSHDAALGHDRPEPHVATPVAELGVAQQIVPSTGTRGRLRVRPRSCTLGPSSGIGADRDALSST